MCEVHDYHAEEDAAAPTIAGVSFAVADMTCSHCVGTVRAAIERALPGVSLDINLASHRVTVAGDAAAAAAAIRAAGYTPELVDR
jgi:copper chaperone